MRHPLGARLTVWGADLGGDLGLHQLTRDQRDRVAHEVAVLARHHLGDDIGSGHPLAFGHRGVLLHVGLLEEPTSLRPTVAGPTTGLPASRYTTSTASTLSRTEPGFEASVKPGLAHCEPLSVTWVIVVSAILRAGETNSDRLGPALRELREGAPEQTEQTKLT